MAPPARPSRRQPGTLLDQDGAAGADVTWTRSRSAFVAVTRRERDWVASDGRYQGNGKSGEAAFASAAAAAAAAAASSFWAAMENLEITVSSITADISIQEDQTELSFEELNNLMEELRISIGDLKMETEMFQKALDRVMPQDVPQPILTRGQSSQDLSQARVRHRSRTRSFATERLQLLTADQKSDIAHRELEETKERVQTMKLQSERTIQNLLAVREEAEVGLIEIQKSTQEFERDFGFSGSSKKGIVIPTEKIYKYMEDRIRAKDIMIDRLRLKSTALMMQKSKLYQQLRQKEEMGEVLHEVDFQQLKIENRQHMEKISVLNDKLLWLKVITGQTQQVLNNYKRQLQKLITETKRLNTEIKSRHEMSHRIKIEMEEVEEERDKEERQNKKFRGLLSDYRVPEVLEYVCGKRNRFDLEQKLKTWKRKVDVAQLSHKTSTEAWERLKKYSTNAQNWDDELWTKESQLMLTQESVPRS
eukprot:gi/632972946/ref/XP_007902908.1/ PREDICTED: coiled-coil domain-containing protein 113 [Callorhinchus milii]